MVGLDSVGLRPSLDLLAAVGAADSVESFAGALVAGLPTLVPADVAVYNEVDLTRGRVTFVTNPPEAAFEGSVDALMDNIGDHPILMHHARGGSGEPATISDFVTLRRFRQTGLFASVFRPLSVDHQLAFTLPTLAPLLVGIALMRGGRDFTERERELMRLLRRPLAQAFAGVRLRSELAALQTDGAAMTVVLGQTGAILGASADALELLRQQFGWRTPSTLPAELEDVSREGAGNWVRGKDGWIHARRVEQVLLLRLQRTRTRDLTPRELEVLALVAEGLTNAEIAERLVVTTRTVKKHMERIMSKLDAHTRTEAAAALR